MYKWQYDEMKQVGIDFTDFENIEYYDSNMQKIRDFKREHETIFNYIDISPEKTIIEFGTGTGKFALEAAKRCSKVYAVDISKTMLDVVKNKAKDKDIKNIEFCHAGFLTYENIEKVDAIVTQLALHHLPDFWKMVALRRMSDMLKDGGKLYLSDVVYYFDIDNHAQSFDDWIENIRMTVGEKWINDAVVTIRDEYPTMGFIMEELISRSGFHIDCIHHNEGFFTSYTCRKI